jgi:hypothetical protein
MHPRSFIRVLALGAACLSALAGAAQARAAARPVAGYSIVDSGAVASPDGRQVRGTASCPAGEVPLGGGVFVASGSTLASINSTVPLGRSWAADVNNASGAATTFHVIAICAVRPQGYAVRQSATRPNPSGSVTSATARCPAGTRPLGGGAASSTTAVAATLHDSLPLARGWRVAEGNGTTGDAKVTAFVVCGSVAGYAVVRGPDVTVPGGTQMDVAASCPVGTSPIGGGATFTSTFLGLSLNSTAPATGSWHSTLNDTTMGAASAAGLVVCARLDRVE